MVLLLATGAVPPAIAGLLAAGAVVLTGVFTSPGLPGGLVDHRGARCRHDPAVDGLHLDRHRGPHRRRLLDLVGRPRRSWRCSRSCVLTMVLGQLISNTATVLIMVPIAAVVAADLGASCCRS